MTGLDVLVKSRSVIRGWLTTGTRPQQQAVLVEQDGHFVAEAPPP